jgi:hypothetical protein
MPSKNSKQTVQKAETSTPVAPVAQPVAQQAVTQPAAQKGGKKVAAKTEAAPVVAAPVAAAPVAATPAPAQKGGKKAAAKTEAPVAATAAPVAATPAQKGGKKAAAPKKEAAVPAAEATAPVAAQKGGKKAAAPKKEKAATAAPKKAAAPKKEATEAAEDGEDEVVGGRRIRSFKVQLPNKEDFEGRFTGLTPYQAANKALSKYFRETKEPMVEVTFSICESTRKSKKSVYTYVGKRLKLETPVTYQIQDGREIVKNFKNSLKKVKKSEAKTSSA